uniref:Uncharacterized protein n=1 Tax=Phlebotomus kandelakii TaxID=1109342 RepID=A0A6B2EK42_9DIPT
MGLAPGVPGVVLVIVGAAHVVHHRVTHAAHAMDARGRHGAPDRTVRRTPRGHVVRFRDPRVALRALTIMAQIEEREGVRRWWRRVDGGFWGDAERFNKKRPPTNQQERERERMRGNQWILEEKNCLEKYKEFFFKLQTNTYFKNYILIYMKKNIMNIFPLP